MDKQATIVICEDHPIYAKGMEDFLKNHFNVAGNFNTGKDVINYLENNESDFLLLDLNLPDTNGLEIIKILKEKNISVKTVIVSMYNDKMLVEKCKKIGVHAYCSKNVTNQELLDILGACKEGVFLVDSSIKRKIKNREKDLVLEDFEQKIKLTKREKELITFFAKGLTSKEIANQLFVSVFTVDTHKKNIYKKLNVNSTAALVKFYYENF